MLTAFRQSVARWLWSIMCLVFLAGCSVTPTGTTPSDTAKSAATPHELQASAGVPSPPASTRVLTEKISFVAVGDIMLGTNFPEDRLPGNGTDLLRGVRDILNSADITFGNYEGTLMDGGTPVKQCKDPARCYVFRTPPYYVLQLQTAGFDVMSLANNHARDFGEEGRQASMGALASVGIRHSGLEGDVASWEVNGLRIALIAYAPFRGSNDPLDVARAQSQIGILTQQHDIVIVSMHMGAEGETATRVPFTDEIFYGENRGNAAAFSHAVIDAGADLVIGHGPHVPRALELYQDRLVAYSLGNFCTYYGINVNGLNGLAPILRVELAADGRFLRGEIISTRQYRPNGPLPDHSHQAARLIAELTQLDFPQTLLEISATGQISKKTGNQMP